MFEFLISKYDPRYRVDGVYTRNEWSGENDIGRIFFDGMLTREEYESTIKRYVECAVDILAHSHVGHLMISNIERYEDDVKWEENEVLDIQQIPLVISDCLHEKYWCRLSAKTAFIHFGYELYMYIGCNIAHEVISTICKQHGLFVVERESPYKEVLL